MAKKKRRAPSKGTATKKKSPKTDAAKKKAKPDVEPPKSKEMLHYEEIRSLNEEVRTAFDAWDIAKHEAKGLKETYEVKCGALSTLITTGLDPQTKLDFGDGDSSVQSYSDKAPLAGWMLRPLGAMSIPKGLIIKLEEGGIETIGQLDQFWKDGRVLSDLKGIAAEKAGLIADLFADYGKEHPEIYGMEPADEAADQTHDDESQDEEGGDD